MSWHLFVGGAVRGVILACIACCVLPTSARGQTSTPVQSAQASQSARSSKSAQPSQSGVDEQVPIDLYREPRPKYIARPNCAGHMGRDLSSEACQTLSNGTEGWVELAFMVDPKGKPFEVTVTRSTGVKEFEKAAVNSIERSLFVPASLDGKPVESGYEMRYNFFNPWEVGRGARPDFNRSYKALLAAVNAGDRAAADQAMKSLKVTNLAEDADFGVATFIYASKWGDDSAQLAGLRRAIAMENYPHFLPRPLFMSVMLNCLRLELKMHYYAEALAAAKTLQKNHPNKAAAAQVASIIGQLQKLRSDDTAYAVAGSLQDGSWNLYLFKKHFKATVSEGSISQVKLRCPTRYVAFQFDPKLEYTIESKHGYCSLELDGAPGTKFTLVQF